MHQEEHAGEQEQPRVLTVLMFPGHGHVVDEDACDRKRGHYQGDGRGEVVLISPDTSMCIAIPPGSEG